MAILDRVVLRDQTLKAIRRLGGSGSIPEIEDAVVSALNLPEEDVNRLHGEGPMTELQYRLGWARTSLKGRGFITNSRRGIWSLTPEGESLLKLDKGEDACAVILESSASKTDAPDSVLENDYPSSDVELYNEEWKEKLLKTLNELEPAAFERLCQRLLRESGFVEVDVTGRSGDGGIDGRGLFRLAGLIGFPVLFQCKRYTGSSRVTASQVRDFRGAMTGRADRGLIITTGSFTQDAQREATRDGAPPIDLIDRQLLIDKLKELELGLTTRQVEVVDVDENWFANL